MDSLLGAVSDSTLSPLVAAPAKPVGLERSMLPAIGDVDSFQRPSDRAAFRKTVQRDAT